MYSALSIAKYIISYGLTHDKPVTNLKLQKLLYYLWIEYYKSTRKFLFEDNICAWPLGPVVPEVYFEYCSYAGATINQPEKFDIEQADRCLLDSILEKYIKYTAGKLVSLSHEAGKPWEEVYSDGFGNRQVIPFRKIIDLEC